MEHILDPHTGLVGLPSESETAEETNIDDIRDEMIDIVSL